MARPAKAPARRLQVLSYGHLQLLGASNEPAPAIFEIGGSSLAFARRQASQLIRLLVDVTIAKDDEDREDSIREAMRCATQISDILDDCARQVPPDKVIVQRFDTNAIDTVGETVGEGLVQQ